MFQKTTSLEWKTNINLYKFVRGTLTPCYLGFWVQFHTKSLEHHMHRFCPYDLNHYVNGTIWKYVIARPSIPTKWPIQKGTNLTQKEVTTLEEVGFSFDHNHVWSLFGSQSSSSSISYVHAMNARSIVRPIDASCWPITHGGKKVRRPSIFKITQ